MRTKIFAGALAALVVGLVASACDSGEVYEEYGPHGDPCNQFSTCGACTPVNGCGWCATGPSQGMCASDPDECDQAQQFSWTWNATGCFVAADAGITTTVPEAGVTDSAPTTTVDSGPGSAGNDGAAADGDAASTDDGPGTTDADGEALDAGAG